MARYEPPAEAPGTVDDSFIQPRSGHGGSPRVLAVVVTHNGGGWLPECLRALGQQVYPRLDTVVVDSGSSRDVAQEFADLLPHAEFVRVERNVGFGAAANAALEVSTSAREAEYFLFLHDDVELEPETLSLMIATAMETDAGIVGAKGVQWDHPEILVEVGMSADQFGYPYSGLDPGEIDQGQHDMQKEVLYVTSACMLVSRSFVERCGLWDAGYFAFGEDLDLCTRARLAGFRVMVQPGAKFRHAEALSNERRNVRVIPSTRFLTRRNRLRTITKNVSLYRMLPIMALYMGLSVAEVFVLIFFRRFEQIGEYPKALASYLASLPDVLRRRRAVQKRRAVPDRRLRRLMVSDSDRARVFLERRLRAWERGTLALGARTLSHLTPSAIKASLVRRMRKPSTIAVVLISMMMVVAIRKILVGAQVAGGSLWPFPDAPTGAFLGGYLAAWRDVGLGTESAAPPAFVLLWISSLMGFGSPGFAQKLLLLFLVGAGLFGMYRFVSKRTSSRPARVLGFGIYALGPVTQSIISKGDLGALAMFAGLPYMLEIGLRILGLNLQFPTPLSRRRRSRGKANDSGAAQEPERPDEEQLADQEVHRAGDVGRAAAAEPGPDQPADSSAGASSAEAARVASGLANLYGRGRPRGGSEGGFEAQYEADAEWAGGHIEFNRDLLIRDAARLALISAGVIAFGPSSLVAIVILWSVLSVVLLYSRYRGPPGLTVQDTAGGAAAVVLPGHSDDPKARFAGGPVAAGFGYSEATAAGVPVAADPHFPSAPAPGAAASGELPDGPAVPPAAEYRQWAATAITVPAVSPPPLAPAQGRSPQRIDQPWSRIGILMFSAALAMVVLIPWSFEALRPRGPVLAPLFSGRAGSFSELWRRAGPIEMFFMIGPRIVAAFVPIVFVVGVLAMAGPARRKESRLLISVWLVFASVGSLVAFGVVPSPAASPEIWLTVPWLTLAVLGAHLLAGLKEELPRHPFGWRHQIAMPALAVLALVGIVIGWVPSLSDWGRPEQAFAAGIGEEAASISSFLRSTAEEVGDFRVLWLGDRWVDPVTAGSRRLDGPQFLLTGPEGLDMLQAIHPPPSEGERRLEETVASLVVARVHLAGHLLAPAGIRFIIADPTDKESINALRSQRDVALEQQQGSIAIFRNLQWLPRAVLAPASLTPQIAGGRSKTRLMMTRWSGGRKIPQRSESSFSVQLPRTTHSQILLGDNFNRSWRARVGDKRLEHHLAFGWANRFVLDPAAKGEVRVWFAGRWLRLVWLGLQGLVLLVVSAVALARRRETTGRLR